MTNPLNKSPATPRHPGAAGERTELTPRRSPRSGGFVLLAFAAFWNIVGWYHLNKTWAEARSGDGDGTQLVVTAFVALTGILLLFKALRGLLRRSVPVPRVVLGSGAYRLGDEVELEWSFELSDRELERVRIAVEGREESSVTRDDVQTRSVDIFHEQVLFEKYGRSRDLEYGELTFTLPRGLPPSSHAPNHRVVWLVSVSAEVSGLRELDVDFAFHVGGEAP